MSDPIADAKTLEQRRLRARAGEEATFLHDLARSEIQERLIEVNRSFTDVAIVTAHPHLWAADFEGATCVAPTDTLDLAEGAFDLVVHAMALHWASDPVGQIIQCRRALQPDGLFLAVGFGGGTLQELRSVLATAETEVTGGLSPRVAPMAEVRDMGALLQRAGLALPVADVVRQTASYASLTSLMHDLRAMGETNALHHRARIATKRQVFARADTLYRQHFSNDSGRLDATFELVFLAGWAPSASQPKPLRPGSAQHSLAQALGTDEVSLPDRPKPGPRDLT